MTVTKGLVAVAACLVAGYTAAQETMIQRGEYLVHAGGCISCHTAEDDEGGPLAGGRALDSPFGTFYTPNITPHPGTGIGGWSEQDFLTAFWDGISPLGGHYFPAFPYTSYTGMTREDVLAIRAYLLSLEPIERPNSEHELPWYLSTRLAAGAWKLLFFNPGRFEADSQQSPEWNRGAYLVRHLGHCGECHTPRNSLGALRQDRELAGNPNGPEDTKVPDITPNRDTGIGAWSAGDIEFFLELGMLPDGDFVGSAMAPVVDDNTSQLTADDRGAIAVYVKSVAPSEAE